MKMTREQANRIFDNIRDELCKEIGKPFEEVWHEFFGHGPETDDTDDYEHDDRVKVIGYDEDGTEITNGFRE